MKTKKLFICSFLFLGLTLLSNAQITSVANGNWTSPATWGGMPPTPGSDVIINHTVILDIDYAFSSGSITVNGAGALNGNNSMRALALLTGGNGALTIHGSLNIARMALFAGSVSNNGIIQSDSLFNALTLNNNTGATINASQFMNNTGAQFTNNGTVTTTNFLNIETAVNNNSMTTNDFMNCKFFTNASTGTINIGHNFNNSDSLASPSVFTNDGIINVGNDWLNTQGVNGSGRFCIAHNSMNTGLMTGNFDFCDQTGGNIDANTGTIGPNITYCLYPCNVSIEKSLIKTEINVFPNPGNGLYNFVSSELISFIEVYDILGKKVYTQEIDSQNFNINISKEASGVYFYRLYNADLLIKTGKLIKK